MEIVSPEGLRVDGRRPEEVRRFSVQIGTFEGANGSAYVEMGHTKCLVAVYGPKEVKKEISKKLWKGLSVFIPGCQRCSQDKRAHRFMTRPLFKLNIVSHPLALDL